MTYLTSTHVRRKRPMAGNQRGSVSISDTWASDTWAADTWTRVRAGCSAEAGP